MDPDTKDWPEGMVQIANIIGTELTIKLVEQYGGVSGYYIPKLKTRAGLFNPWAKVIGEDAWRKLCKALGGRRIELPRGSHQRLKKRLILELAEDGKMSHRAIALQAGVTTRYVKIILSGLDGDKQISLF
jgi:hypothetical protein